MSKRSTTNTKKTNNRSGDEFKVSGQVFNSLGEPIAKQKVWAADVNLRGGSFYKTVAAIKDVKSNEGFDFLDEGTTDKNGYYSITFNAKTYKRNEPGLADVIVFAIDEDKITGRSKLASKLDYIKNELQNWNINLPDANKRGISEYTRLIQVIEPFVKQSKLQLYELNSSPDQVNFLASETSQDQSHTALAVWADVLKNDLLKQNKTNLRNSVISIYRELFYGIGRQGITLFWITLLQKTRSELQKAINQSIKQNIIDPQDAKLISDFITNIADVSVEQSYKAGETESFYKKIGFVIKEPELQKSFAKMYFQFKGKPESFWGSLSKQRGFTTDIVKALQLTNQLSILTGHNTALIEELQVNKAIENPSDLLALTLDVWDTLIHKTGVPDSIPGNSDEEKAVNYRNSMQNLLNGAYPTQRIALMVEDKDKPFPIKDASVKEGVSAFFRTAQNFDISTMRITDFDKTINTIVNNDKSKHDQLLNQLQMIQRIYQVSPTPEIMKTLLDKRYTSAYHISSVTQNAFINKEANDLGGSHVAYSVYNRARFQVMRAQHTLLKIRDTQDKTTPSKIITTQQQQAITTFLNKLKNANS